MNTPLTCRLCGSKDTEFFTKDKRRAYYRCNCCKLIFVPDSFLVSLEKEKEQYDYHNNSIEDKGYVAFLNRLCEPMCELLDQAGLGLDFGSGPGPTLNQLFERKGHTVKLYDYFYANRPEHLTLEYDFITASEVFEHLHDPLEELKRLWKCLKKGGYLGIMTGMYDDVKHFKSWWYKNDVTHIAFYSKDTFVYLSDKLNADIVYQKNNVIILRK